MQQFIDIGNGLLIPMYNLLIGLGAIFGFLYLEKDLRDKKISFETNRNIYLSLIPTIGLSFLGAKFFELIYQGNNLNLLNLYSGGVTFMGGLITGALFFFIFNLVFKTDNKVAFNLLVPFIIISHLFGRIGCFLAGCCFGKPTNSILGVTFPDNSLPAHHFSANTSLHPTQLYEAVFLGFLFILIKKLIGFDLRLSFYLMMYGIFRFFIEFLRGDNRGQIITDLLTPSQLFSIIFFGIGLLILMKIKNPI